jgi:hypothetical protein
MGFSGSNATGNSGNIAKATVSVTPNCTLTATPSTITAGGSSTLTTACNPAATSYAWINPAFATNVTGGTVSPTTTTTYSVIGSNAAGAGNSTSAVVTVNPVPPPPPPPPPAPPTCTLTAVPPAIAGGGTSTLTASCSPAADSYAWSGNTGFASTASGGIVSPAVTTTYSVQGSSNAGGPGGTVSVTVYVKPACTLTASPSTVPGGSPSTLTATCSPAPDSYVWTNTGFASAASSGTVSPTATTTYSVIGRNAAGDGPSASVTVSVTPHCTLTASPSTIPGGGSSTLTASCVPAATSYVWTNTGFATTASSGTVSPTTTTTYSVVGSNAVGAGDSASVTVGVTPTCTLTASPGTVTIGDSSVLTATCSPPADTYAWTNSGFGPTVNIGTVTPTVSTTYSVIGSNAAGAGNRATATVSVTTCTYSLSPTSQSVPLTISNGALSVTSTLVTLTGATSISQSNSSACTWTAVSNVDWITLPFNTSGSGNGTIFYSVAGNTNGGPRTGTLTVGGQTFTVRQQGMTVPTCTLTASASTINLNASVVLTATCTPAATSYAWTPAAGLVPGPANTATVTPTAVGTYQYSVAGSNAGGAGNLASTMVTVAPATFISQSDCLFNWAESNYPIFFGPAGAMSNILAPYYYRYYLQSNAYLGTSAVDSHVYYLGPLSNNSILDVGALSGWLLTAGCQ